MNKPIQIRLLSKQEAASLTGTSRFNLLRPARCKNCGNTYDFERRVFGVGGVPKADRSSDDTQALIAYHVRENFDVGYVFFKTYRDRFYVDSAVCRKCGSTLVTFDIDLTDEILAKASRIAGKPAEQVRADIEALADTITVHRRKVEQSANADTASPAPKPIVEQTNQKSRMDRKMSKLGTEKRPIAVRVRTEQRARYVAEQCDANGWHYVIGIEPDKPEDIRDLEKASNPPVPAQSDKISRNDPCPCGSGKKYKKCCGLRAL
ncbi:MAG: PBPRA1643 family SWIM/SEC-C metal-binding motif protein [Pseudomonadota bacterium]